MGDKNHTLDDSFSGVIFELVETSLFPFPQNEISKIVRSGLLSGPWCPVDHMV